MTYRNLLERIRNFVLLALLMAGCATQIQKPKYLSTIPPGQCSIDGGKHWFPAGVDGMCHVEDARPATAAPHWGPQPGDPQPFGICSWCSQKGQWTCPVGYRIVDTRTGKLPLLSDEQDDRLGSVMICKAKP